MKRMIILVVSVMLVFAMVGSANAQVTLPGRLVSIWSKGAEKFVRSSGVGGILLADRKSYEANDEGIFLCLVDTGGTVTFTDMMQGLYLTQNSEQLISALTGTAQARRFTAVDLGNNYYALLANNGKYVRVNEAGYLVVDTTTIDDNAIFAIVPVRTGPNVVARAYRGDDPWNQLPNDPDEAQQYISHPDEFPVCKTNVGMLQMSPNLYSDQQFLAMREVWNTDQYETEFILPYVDYSQKSMIEQVDGLIGRIKRMEGLGYTFDYVILYHEILAGLPGGPWSDPRISSQEEIDLFRERVTAAYTAGEVNFSSYKVFTMPYQFNISLMGIPPYENTPVGCDAETLEFIKNNFDGMFLEVNGHDYSSRNEDADAAAAAIWCRDNGLEFGITSGWSGDGKDTRYKGMYNDIFAEMANVGFDKSWDRMHYILHHSFDPYEDRLPEWSTDTVMENCKWLIENVMPYETPSPAFFYDDFYTYSSGSINGQSGSPVGFSGSWTANAAVTVSSGVLNQGADLFRSYRSLKEPVSSGTVYLRANMAISNASVGVNFSALELDQSGGSGDLAIRFQGFSEALKVNITGGTGGSDSSIIMANDAGYHQWLIELNLDTRAGKVWIDPDIYNFDSSVGGAAFTAPSGFSFNSINVSTFGGSSSVSLDKVQMGGSWSDIGVIDLTEVPDKSYLDNGQIRVGVSQKWGGAIDYLAESNNPSRNYVNRADAGRLIQRSYFGPPYSSNGPFGSWPWNPVQGGDGYENVSGVLELTNDGTTIYTKCQPMDWSGNNRRTNAIFETWITLEGRAVRIESLFTNADEDHAQWQDQELLAVHVTTDLSALKYYGGTDPFANGPLTSQLPGGTNEYYAPTEYWAAFVNSSDFGLGAFSQDAMYLTTFRVGTQGITNDYAGDTNYFAIIPRFTIPNNAIRREVSYVMLDTVDNMRDFVYSKAQTISDVHWTFEENNNRQGWSAVNIDDTTLGVDNGKWSFTTPSSDPHIISPHFEVPADIFDSVTIRMSSTNSSVSGGLYWSRIGDEILSFPYSKAFTILPDGQMHTYSIDMSSNSNWSGIINKIRLDPGSTGDGGTVSIDYIKIKSNIVGDVDNNGLIRIDDLEILSQNWLKSGFGIDGDLSGDNFVDLADFALFSQQWSPPVLIDPDGITATANYSYSPGRSPQYAVNGGGMTGLAHASDTPTYQMWMGGSQAAQYPQWIAADLGSSYDMDRIMIYNFNWDGYTVRGCKNIQVYYSNSGSDPGNPVDNPGNWTPVGSAFDLAEAPGEDDYGTTNAVLPGEVSLSGITARWISIKINTSWYGGGSANGYCGLSEILFYKE